MRTRPNVLTSLGTVRDYVLGNNYEPSTIDTFLLIANYFLIAHALTGSYDVVSHKIAPNSGRRIKISSVCIGLGIRCVTPFEILRLERARFILKSGL